MAHVVGTMQSTSMSSRRGHARRAVGPAQHGMRVARPTKAMRTCGQTASATSFHCNKIRMGSPLWHRTKYVLFG
jgi:hypothetical protein